VISVPIDNQTRIARSGLFTTNCFVPAGRRACVVIRVYDDAGNVIETHEHKGDFREF
jgi:hypothetical protein